jgi:glycosyltransferase involved in cell wall biosynthesis
MPALSVILCTHNPRRDYLERTLEGLRRQQFRDFELLIIDNASTPPLAGTLDLSWHPDARVVVEPALGLTRARLCGIALAKAATLVFVDDDNVLAPDYLEQAAAIALRHPQIGAWGGGIVPEYEVTPAPEVHDLLPGLALRDVMKTAWSNFSWDSIPYGAGLCVRSTVARAYADTISGSPERMGLGRAGNQLLASEDVDLSMTAWDQGLATGLFPELHLVHLIPAKRVEPDYLRKICAGAAYSNRLLEYMRSGVVAPGPPAGPWLAKLTNRLWWLLCAPKAARHYHEAVQSGRAAADAEIQRRETDRRQS